jgi:hypothetical protein
MLVRNEKVIRHYLISAVLLTVIATSPAMATICQIGNQQLACTGTPPVCPQGQSACTSTSYLASGSASVSGTGIANKNGFKRIETQTPYLYFYGWSCTISSCTEKGAGGVAISGGDVSGAVNADQITGMNGNGENLDFYNGSALIGSITVSGCTFSGSVSAPNGLMSVSASTSGTVISFTGMDCTSGNCTVSNAGTITVSGAVQTCPLGSQYLCSDTGSGYVCSSNACFDETAGGKFSLGSQICAKDLNGDGSIDFDTEVKQCTAINAVMFCPIDAVDCSQSFICSLGTYNTARQRCEYPIAGPSCPKGMNYDSGNNICYATATAKSTCPYGSQYTCVTDPKTNIPQCSDLSCFSMSSQQTQQTTVDMKSYQDDGMKDQKTGKCTGQIYIFNGKPSECEPAGRDTNFFNCCNTDPGQLLFIKETCGDAQALTVRRVGKKQCHSLGTYCKKEWPLIGCVQKAKVYCCFTSELSRIIQEQGRAQLKTFNGWGTPKKPDCRGFTPEEFQHLDFSKIDLSEFINDLQTAAQSAIQDKMKTGVTNYYNRLKDTKQ